MHRFNQWLKLCIVLLGLLATSSCLGFNGYVVVKQTISTLPEFITKIETGRTDDGSDTLCVEVSQKSIVERGNNAEQLAAHIRETVELRVDNAPVPKNDPTGFEWLVLEALIENGKVVATYGGEISFCYLVEQLATGQHTATFSVESVSGVRYSYTWQFELESVFQADR